MSRDLTQWIGMEFEPFHFVIERGKIREFVLAIGDSNPIYQDPNAAQQAGFDDIPLPPTFATVIDMWGGLDFFSLVKTLELNLLKVLHGEQEYEYLADVYPGDQLTGRMRVTDVKSRPGSAGGMNLIRLETTYTNQHGERVLIAKSTVIERH